MQYLWVQKLLKVSFLIRKVDVIFLDFLKVNYLLLAYYIKELNLNMDIIIVLIAWK